MKNKTYVTFAEKKVKIKILTTKNFVKLRIVVFIPVNTEVLYITYVIQDIIYLKKSEKF